jgi:HK97 family phage major capsid protein
MKKKLLELLAKKEARKNEIITKSATTEDVAELRAFNTEMEALNTEIRSLQEMIAEIPDDQAGGTHQATDPDQRTAAVNGQIPGAVIAGAKDQEQRGAEGADKFSTVEYRTAFMNYCRTGEAIPAEYRLDAYTDTTEAAAVIPTTIMAEILKEMKVYGQLFNRVRKTNVPGGVRVPILSLKPAASRITESAVSARQKITANTYVTFSYYGLECKVAVSLLAGTVTLDAFEATIVPLITEAMVKQCEIEIIKGTGEGQMLGVTVDTRVAAGQKITLTADEMTDWGAWKKKVFAKIPLAYKAGGIFVMGSGTFDGYIDGMQDANGQPIGRVNYGIADAPQYRFGGKEVLEVEEDVIASYDTANSADVIAVFMNPGDYAINSNMQMTMYRWFDHDTNQWVDKAILINDGKLLDAAGVLIIKKG